MLKTTLRSLCIVLVLAGCTGKSDKGTTAPASSGSGDSGGWKYDEHPTAALVPDATPRGTANGKPLQLEGAYFEPGFNSWELRLIQTPLANPTDFTKPGEQFVAIDLPEQPAAGKKWTKSLKSGDGFFQINDPKDATHTTSWNAPNAYYVEITSWDVKPYDPKGSLFQGVGKASGKVYVAYQGGFGFENSGVAGTFKDAPVRYLGKPPAWMEKQAGTPQANTAGLPPTNGATPGLPPPTNTQPQMGQKGTSHTAPAPGPGPMQHAGTTPAKGTAPAGHAGAVGGPPGKGAPPGKAAPAGHGGKTPPPPPMKHH